ncbi:hypothetical protein PpBr36_07560 [Pyricularia pennisetigena]|uniref:hypothetical protein n=1 Tax=Pyricularia pennisetigena TaxID=1578925 RepID=UPI00114D5A54|nr:hypothetical protein PpBr36_07560 [Pyricularia pennisetigena]TLS25215.1 hypothetical protein PpBr36_07560 [Pyricularia pennisetigena]
MVLVTMQPPPRLPVRLITHNIRYATTSPSPNELPWAERRSHLFSQLTFTTAGRDTALVCLQEVLHGQLLDVAAALGPSWAHVGVGRDDGAAEGEHSPVFYRRDVWRAEQARTYWLSKTPSEPSVGWDAALPRVVTAVRLRHKATGAAVVVMSTHLDHRGEVARRESAGVLLALAEEWSTDGHGRRLPVFLGGDFNSAPGEGAYEAITKPGEGAGMRDMSTVIPEEKRYGYKDVTYTSFGEPDEIPKRIDFLFVKDKAAEVRFVTFGVLSNRFDDKVFLSDHRAVVADVEIPVDA